MTSREWYEWLDEHGGAYGSFSGSNVADIISDLEDREKELTDSRVLMFEAQRQAGIGAEAERARILALIDTALTQAVSYDPADTWLRMVRRRIAESA